MGFFDRLKRILTSDISKPQEGEQLKTVPQKILNDIETSEEETTYIKSDAEKDLVERLNFEVKGTFVDERQAVLKEIVRQLKKLDAFFLDPYEGMTNKEIKEETYGEKIYEYEGSSILFGELEDEPENEYDPNAIKVNLVDDGGNRYFIGYVPKELTLKIKELREEYPHYVATSLLGGKYKMQEYNDYGEDVIVKGEDEYGIELSVSFWRQMPDHMQENLDKIKNKRGHGECMNY